MLDYFDMHLLVVTDINLSSGESYGNLCIIRLTEKKNTKKYVCRL